MSQTNNIFFKAKSAIMMQQPVKYNGAAYTPTALIWHWDPLTESEYYSIRLIDKTAKNSSVEAQLKDVEFEKEYEQNDKS